MCDMPQIFIHRYLFGIHGRTDQHLVDDDLDLLQVYLPVNWCLPLLLVQGKTFSDNCTHPMCGHCLVKGGDFFSRRAAGHRVLQQVSCKGDLRLLKPGVAGGLWGGGGR